jgi:hypothetical protein
MASKPLVKGGRPNDQNGKYIVEAMVRAGFEAIADLSLEAA